MIDITARYTSAKYSMDNERTSTTSLREYPYPYKAALAISSDIDGTHTVKEFLTIQEFLNTNNMTEIGIGLGLEIGNSFFPVAIDTEFAFLSPNPVDKRVIIELINLGYIDFIHSFNTANNKSEIDRIMDSLSANHINLDIWVNHSRARNNLGYHPGFSGDNVESDFYHTDLSVKRLGYDFYWQHAVSGIVGQGRSISVSSFFDGFDYRKPFQTFYHYTLLELVKYSLSLMDSKEYQMRKSNDLVIVSHLDDGQPIFEFTRSNFGYAGLWESATADGLSSSLRESILQRLIKVGGYAIIYTHFGRNNGFPYLSDDTKKALERLAQHYRDGNIWVTTSAKLLNYYVNKNYLKWNAKVHGDSVDIIIENVEDPVRGKFIPDINDIQALTFYTKYPAKTRIFINNKKINDIQYNYPEDRSENSLMIKSIALQNIDSVMHEYKKQGYF